MFFIKQAYCLLKSCNFVTDKEVGNPDHLLLLVFFDKNIIQPPRGCALDSNMYFTIIYPIRGFRFNFVEVASL